MSTDRPPLKLAALLATVFALSPLAIDLYLPTMPAIAGELAVPIQDIAITVSLYILGLSLGQFIGGPLSDYLGRRPVMFSGLLIFAAASLGLAYADSLALFWAARVVQAFGGGVASVVVPAIIRDSTEGQASAKLFALTAFIMIFAPALAPGLGTLIYSLGGWRSVFVVLAVYALAVMLLIWRLLPMAAPGQASNGESLLQRYKFVLGHGRAMRYLLTQGLAFSVMMTFLANAADVYMQQYGRSEGVFSILFAANVLCMAVINRLNNRLLDRIAAARILRWALYLQLAACAVLLVLTGFQPPLWLVVPCIMLTVGALGGVIGNTQACCLQYFPRHAGVASALLGSSQYAIGALVSGLSTRFHSDLMWPMTATMAVAALLAVGIVPRPSAADDALGRQPATAS